MISDDKPTPKDSNGLDELSQRIAGLSATKRALLELRLKKQSPAASSEPTIFRRTNRDFSPLSFSQQRLWFLHQFDPQSPVYNVAKAIKLKGTLNV